MGGTRASKYGMKVTTMTAATVVALVFERTEPERWDGQFFALSTREQVRAYCRHNYIPAERAEEAELPLCLTKRGVLVRATRTT